MRLITYFKLPSSYALLTGLLAFTLSTAMAQVPSPPPDMGPKQVGAHGTVARPANPWNPQGGWNKVYDGQTFDGDPLEINNQTDVLIINCTIRNVNGPPAAIRLRNSKRVLVLNNVVTGHRYKDHGSGIIVGYDGDPCEYVIIENNTIRDEDGNGISTGGSSTLPRQANPVPGLIIRDNLIHDVGKYADPNGNSPKHGMYIKATDALIENNVVYNCFDGSGISIRSTGVVRGNKVWNTKGGNLVYWPQKVAGSSEKLIIENNVVYQDDDYTGPRSDKPLLRLGSSKPPKFNDFTIRFNTVVVFADVGRSRRIVDLATDHYNNVKAYGNLVVDLRDDNPKYFTRESEATFFEKNFTTTSEAGFVDVASRDFRLTADHPAVGYVPASANLPSYPKTDLQGNKRQYPLDAGAYAFSNGDDSGNVTVRARGTSGTEQIEVRYNDQRVGERITLSTSYQEYKVQVDNANGNFKVAFVNDASGRNVYIDWLQVGTTRRQAESRATNTGAWANGECGGGTRTEVLHCNGYIDFGTMSSGAPIGQTIWLRSQRSGNFVTANLNVTNSPLTAAWATSVQDWERFVVIRADAGRIALRSAANDQYVATENNRTDKLLRANRNAVGEWEQYQWINNSDGTVSLKAQINGLYVKVTSKGDVRALNKAITSEAKFTWGAATNARTAVADTKATISEPNVRVKVFRSYPNPAHAQLMIEAEDSEEYQVTLYDMTGRLMIQHDHLKGKTELDIRHLRSGLYLLKLRDSQQQEVRQRVVIE